MWVLGDGEERERELQLFHLLMHALQNCSQHTSHNTLTRHSRLLHCTLPSPSAESKEIERVAGYQFTVTQMLLNSFAFGGGNICPCVLPVTMWDGGCP